MADEQQISTVRMTSDTEGLVQGLRKGMGAKTPVTTHDTEEPPGNVIAEPEPVILLLASPHPASSELGFRHCLDRNPALGNHDHLFGASRTDSVGFSRKRDLLNIFGVKTLLWAA